MSWDKDKTFKALQGLVPSDQIRRDEPMDRHLTFRAGGPAALFVLLRTEEEAVAVLSCLAGSHAPFFLLGKGSNVLVSDRGYDGVIAAFTDSGAGSGTGDGHPLDRITVDTEHDTLEAGAAVSLAALAAVARDQGLTGLEFAAGIPGSLGGALVMNAGAYGGEMKDCVESVRILGADGSVREIPGAEMGFAYRDSRLKKEGGAALSARIRLAPGDPKKISERMLELARERTAKQPLEYPSAGSTFKRPPGHFAGPLITEAGLKGAYVGGAQVSEKHAGFIVNRGGATASEIYALIRKVQEGVREVSGITLEPEVILLGEFDER